MCYVGDRYKRNKTEFNVKRIRMRSVPTGRKGNGDDYLLLLPSSLSSTQSLLNVKYCEDFLIKSCDSDDLRRNNSPLSIVLCSFV